jgi:hypothetical protein
MENPQGLTRKVIRYSIIPIALLTSAFHLLLFAAAGNNCTGTGTALLRHPLICELGGDFAFIEGGFTVFWALFLWIGTDEYRRLGAPVKLLLLFYLFFGRFMLLIVLLANYS